MFFTVRVLGGNHPHPLSRRMLRCPSLLVKSRGGVGGGGGGMAASSMKFRVTVLRLFILLIHAAAAENEPRD